MADIKQIKLNGTVYRLKDARLNDLETIRAGAAAGATAIQPAAIADMATQTWVGQQNYITAADIPVLSVNGKTGTVVLTAADLGIGSVFDLKGSVATKTALPATGNKKGDVYYVIDESVGYIWLNDGTTDRWEMLGMSVDLSNYVTNDALATALNNYVQKAAGKGLSTNDFTDGYKTKLDAAITSLAGYATEQWVLDKGYTTNTGTVTTTGTMTSAHVVVSNGSTVIKDSGFTIGASVPSNAKFTDTTYSDATTSVHGLMSTADKTKLNGIATGATANTGTVTSVAVKMNGSTKGTVTTSGTIDLGTVLTSHQSLANYYTSAQTDTAIANAIGVAIGGAY